MPRKQNRKSNRPYQRQLDALHLNAERMKLVRLLHCSSGNHYTSDATRHLIKASAILIDKVRGNLGKL